MQAGDWATWIGTGAAAVAAVASVAAWRHGRPEVNWAFEHADRGRSTVRNAGSAVAKQVHVRAGSASDATDIEAEETVSAVSPGEVVRILVAPTYGSRDDFAVVVTWRGRWGREERWTYLPH